MSPPPPAAPKNATGKSLAKEADKLDFLARTAGVTQPSAMLSEPQAALRIRSSVRRSNICNAISGWSYAGSAC